MEHLEVIRYDHRKPSREPFNLKHHYVFFDSSAIESEISLVWYGGKAILLSQHPVFFSWERHQWQFWYFFKKCEKVENRNFLIIGKNPTLNKNLHGFRPHILYLTETSEFKPSDSDTTRLNCTAVFDSVFLWIRGCFCTPYNKHMAIVIFTKRWYLYRYKMHSNIIH